MDHLPALLIVIPLLAAPVAAALPGGRMPWLLATAVSWVVLAMTVAVAVQIGEAGFASYELGGWPPPWGIEIRIDTLNVIVLLVIGGIGAAVMPFAGRSVPGEIPAQRVSLFYCLLLLT